ncbi:MAG: GAF domain-containing protein [Actinomycetia bacterium]|nr:GAF domain-containing protein [Actinomycetes bacterium]
MSTSSSGADLPAAMRRLLDPGGHDELVRSTVRLARLTFTAAAASVFLYHERRGELVFEATSGEGEDFLVGRSIPAGRGIAGWVWQTGETIAVQDLAQDTRFDRSFAEGTGFVPDTILAAPLFREDTTIGVLEVLDPALQRFGEVNAIDLLTELATQTGLALSLLQAARALREGPDSEQLHPLAAVTARLERMRDNRDGALADLAAALDRLVTVREHH